MIISPFRVSYCIGVESVPLLVVIYGFLIKLELCYIVVNYTLDGFLLILSKREGYTEKAIQCIQDLRSKVFSLERF